MRPSAGHQYTLQFTRDGKFELSAACGTWKGSYTFGGKSLAIKMSKNWFSGCRKDPELKIFLEDLERARAAFIKDNRLQITLADSEGIIYFEGR